MGILEGEFGCHGDGYLDRFVLHTDLREREREREREGLYCVGKGSRSSHQNGEKVCVLHNLVGTSIFIQCKNLGDFSVVCSLGCLLRRLIWS